MSQVINQLEVEMLTKIFSETMQVADVLDR